MILKEIKDNYWHLVDYRLIIPENGFEDTLSILNFPFYYQNKLPTTNNIERLNCEIRRQDQVITIFNGVENGYRIIGSWNLMNNEWI